MTDSLVIEKEHNTGNCRNGSTLEDYDLCCERYADCAYRLSRQVLNDEYSGYCFTKLVWECPHCGCENTIRYKPQRQRTRQTNPVSQLSRTNLELPTESGSLTNTPPIDSIGSLRGDA